MRIASHVPFRHLSRAAAVIVLLPSLMAASPARAQQATSQPPIITGTQQSSMDAPEKNSELERYEHSPMVARVSRAFGLAPLTGSRIFEDLNSGILIVAVLWVGLRILPGKFRERKQKLARELTEAHRATEEAQQRLSQIEEKLAALGGEVDELRRHAEEMSRADEERIHAAQEEERARILRRAEAEIVAAQHNAERELKRFASNMAVDRAAARVQLSADGDQALVNDFLRSLAGELGREGKN